MIGNLYYSSSESTRNSGKHQSRVSNQNDSITSRHQDKISGQPMRQTEDPLLGIGASLPTAAAYQNNVDEYPRPEDYARVTPGHNHRNDAPPWAAYAAQTSQAPAALGCWDPTSGTIDVNAAFGLGQQDVSAVNAWYERKGCEDAYRVHADPRVEVFASLHAAPPVQVSYYMQGFNMTLEALTGRRLECINDIESERIFTPPSSNATLHMGSAQQNSTYSGQAYSESSHDNLNGPTSEASPTDSMGTRGTSLTPGWECGFCGKIFDRKQERDRHVRDVEGKTQWQCNRCPFRRAREEDMKRHCLKEHGRHSNYRSVK